MQFAPLYPIIHQILKPIFPQCLWRGDNTTKTIAISFDDGPHPEYTPQLLEVLDRYQIPATFFWLGICVNRFPQVAKLVTAGNRNHWIGLHGYQHHNFPLLAPTQLQDSLQQTQAAIFNACHLSPEQVRDVRPPNGTFTPQTLKLLHQWNYRPVMWTVVPEDWVRPGVDTVVKRVLNQVNNGSIIVLHDGYFGGEDVAHTVDILIPKLLERGYKFVTINDMYQQEALN